MIPQPAAAALPPRPRQQPPPLALTGASAVVSPRMPPGVTSPPGVRVVMPPGWREGDPLPSPAPPPGVAVAASSPGAAVSAHRPASNEGGHYRRIGQRTAGVDDAVVSSLLTRRLDAKRNKNFSLMSSLQAQLRQMRVKWNEDERTWTSDGQATLFKQYMRVPGGTPSLPEAEIADMVANRFQAKLDRNFQVADAIQLRIEAAGIETDDKARTWKVKMIPSDGSVNLGGASGNERRKWIRAENDRADVNTAQVLPLLEDFTRAVAAGQDGSAQQCRHRLWALGVTVDDRTCIWRVRSGATPRAGPAAVVRTRSEGSSPRAVGAPMVRLSMGTSAQTVDQQVESAIKRFNSGPMRSSSGPVRSSSASGTSHSANAGGMQRLVKQMKIPTKYHTMFTGQFGEDTRRHIAQLGADINVPSPNDPGSTATIAIRISGDARAVADVRTYIEERLHECRKEITTPRVSNRPPRDRSRSRSRGRNASPPRDGRNDPSPRDVRPRSPLPDRRLSDTRGGRKRSRSRSPERCARGRSRSPDRVRRRPSCSPPRRDRSDGTRDDHRGDDRRDDRRRDDDRRGDRGRNGTGETANGGGGNSAGRGGNHQVADRPQHGYTRTRDNYPGASGSAVHRKLNERERCRGSKPPDFARADLIREELGTMGVQLYDQTREWAFTRAPADDHSPRDGRPRSPFSERHLSDPRRDDRRDGPSPRASDRSSGSWDQLDRAMQQQQQQPPLEATRSWPPTTGMHSHSLEPTRSEPSLQTAAAIAAAKMMATAHVVPPPSRYVSASTFAAARSMHPGPAVATTAAFAAAPASALPERRVSDPRGRKRSRSPEQRDRGHRWNNTYDDSREPEHSTTMVAQDEPWGSAHDGSSARAQPQQDPLTLSPRILPPQPVVLSRAERLAKIGSHIETHVDEATISLVTKQSTDYANEQMKRERAKPELIEINKPENIELDTVSGTSGTNASGEGGFSPQDHWPLKFRHKLAFPPQVSQATSGGTSPPANWDDDEPADAGVQEESEESEVSDTESELSVSASDSDDSEDDDDDDDDDNEDVMRDSMKSSAAAATASAKREAKKKTKRERLGPWRPDEDAKLIEMIKRDGVKTSDWDAKAAELDTGRSASAVTYRWYRHLSKKSKEDLSKKSKEGSSKKSKSKASNHDFSVGTRITARWLGGKFWYAGVITEVNGDNTCDIHYDDEEDEPGVKTKHIKLEQAKSPKKKPKTGIVAKDKDTTRPASSGDKKAKASKEKESGWSEEEKTALLGLIARSGPGKWEEKAAKLSETKTSATVRSSGALSNQWNVRLKTTSAGLRALATFEQSELGDESAASLMPPPASNVRPAPLSIQPSSDISGSRSEASGSGVAERKSSSSSIGSASGLPPQLESTSSLPSPSPRSSLPKEERDKVDTVVSCTGCDGDTAIQLLHRSNWETDLAVTRWFDRPIRLSAGTGVEKYEPTKMPASRWSSAKSGRPEAVAHVAFRRASLASVFAERKKRQQQGETYAQMYPTREMPAEEIQALEEYVPYTRATVPDRAYRWVDTEDGEMPAPSDLVTARMQDVGEAWQHAARQIQQKISRPSKKVVIGHLQCEEHPSVKFGGSAGAFALFAGEAIKKGAKVGYYSGHLVMSEEMDTNADERLDGRYAVDFPLPPSVPQKNERDCLVIDASCDRNELSFMNDFRDNAYEPPPAEGYKRGPNVELTPTWETFKVDGATYQFPCLLCEAMTDIAVGRELIWDYGDGYWSQLKNLEVQSPKGSADSGIPSPTERLDVAGLLPARLDVASRSPEERVESVVG